MFSFCFIASYMSYYKNKPVYKFWLLPVYVHLVGHITFLACYYQVFKYIQILGTSTQIEILVNLDIPTI